MKTIVCLSSQRWDDGMWTNKQHIMSRLAKEHRVIYVEYGLRPVPLFLYQRLQQLGKNRGGLLKKIAASVVQRDDNLFLFDFVTPLLAGLFPYGTFPRDQSLYRIKTAMVARYLKKQGIDDAIVWVYHPGYGDYVEQIPNALVMYDCVDNYPSFPTYSKNPKWIREREDRLCQKADLVTCTAPALWELKKDHNPENTFLVHNVGDAEHFRKALDPNTEVAPEVSELEGPVIGFVGAVSDYKLNVDWLLHLAKARPNYNVVVVGPKGNETPDLAALKKQANIYLLGHRAYEDLPKYLKGFDVATIPYRINEHTESVFPIKFFEFLASGTPTVVSNLPALHEFYEDVLVAETADEFVTRCDEALEIGDNGIEERLALADANSWPARIGRILELIDERL